MAETLLLGNNRIVDCDAALVVEGVEVFRLRERAHDGQLVVDFDLRDQTDERLATIAKNHVVHVSPSLEVKSQPGLYQVLNPQSGEVLASVEEITAGTVKVTGTFWIKGFCISVGEDETKIGGITFSRNTIQGFKTAIQVGRGTFGIGVQKPISG